VVVLAALADWLSLVAASCSNYLNTADAMAALECVAVAHDAPYNLDSHLVDGSDELEDCCCCCYDDNVIVLSRNCCCCCCYYCDLNDSNDADESYCC